MDRHNLRKYDSFNRIINPTLWSWILFYRINIVSSLTSTPIVPPTLKKCDTSSKGRINICDFFSSTGRCERPYRKSGIIFTTRSSL